MVFKEKALNEVLFIDILAVNSEESIEIAYVPSHLYHVMFELFKVRNGRWICSR